MISEEFQANKAVIEEADMFFSALGLNKGKAASLRKEYKDLEDNMGSIEMEVKKKLLR